MINDKADEVIEQLFESLLNRYKVGLDVTIRGSEFIFDCVYLLCSDCRNFRRVGSYIHCPY